MNGSELGKRISRRAFFSSALATAASALQEANLASAYNDNISIKGNVTSQRKYFPQEGDLMLFIAEVDQDKFIIDGTAEGWDIKPGSVVTLFNAGENILMQQPKSASPEVAV